MEFPTAQPDDEHPHEPGGEPLWGESWYFDFASRDGSLGGYVRLGLYPNLGVAWYWACLVGENRPTVAVFDHAVAPPSGPRSLQVRSDGLWADHTCEEPLERWSLGLESFAVSVDDPTELFADEPRGERVPLGFELEWETEGIPFRYEVTTRYEISCRVHGQIRLGDDALDFDGVGQRDHSWGVRDWWSYSWVWSAFHVDDGQHLFGNEVVFGEEARLMLGYEQRGPEQTDPVACTTFAPVFTPTGTGLVRDIGWRLDTREAVVQPVGWAPLLLRSPEGRESYFPRALCRAELADGRNAVGWMEFNQPRDEPGPPPAPA
jgi:hypothetical protein